MISKSTMTTSTNAGIAPAHASIKSKYVAVSDSPVVYVRRNSSEMSSALWLI